MTTQLVWTKAEVLEALRAELEFYESRYYESEDHLRGYWEGNIDSTGRAIQLVEKMPEAK